jgi:hypothetical protein
VPSVISRSYKLPATSQGSELEAGFGGCIYM